MSQGPRRPGLCVGGAHRACPPKLELWGPEWSLSPSLPDRIL